ncbi:hypothetical protein V502_02600, partial [Pseudogymnoascus sp. VKM F-4520 (FW-2644)]
MGGFPTGLSAKGWRRDRGRGVRTHSAATDSRLLLRSSEQAHPQVSQTLLIEATQCARGSIPRAVLTCDLEGYTTRGLRCCWWAISGTTGQVQQARSERPTATEAIDVDAECSGK